MSTLLWQRCVGLSYLPGQGWHSCCARARPAPTAAARAAAAGRGLPQSATTRFPWRGRACGLPATTDGRRPRQLPSRWRQAQRAAGCGAARPAN